MSALHITGASVTVFGQGVHQSTVCVSDPVAARGDALQLELGEGPHWEARRTGLPVLCPNLTANAVAWPAFALAASEIGMAAVFAIPITMGAVNVGAVDLYSSTARRLDAHHVSLASAMASRLAATAVRSATQSADDPVSTENGMAPALRREVHQATGMIQAQLDVTATEAFARLRAHAFSSGRAMDEIAAAVVARQLNFSELPD